MSATSTALPLASASIHGRPWVTLLPRSLSHLFSYLDHIPFRRSSSPPISPTRSCCPSSRVCCRRSSWSSSAGASGGNGSLDLALLSIPSPAWTRLGEWSGNSNGQLSRSVIQREVTMASRKRGHPTTSQLVVRRRQASAQGPPIHQLHNWLPRGRRGLPPCICKGQMLERLLPISKNILSFLDVSSSI